jgi:hypothetical protein
LERGFSFFFEDDFFFFEEVDSPVVEPSADFSDLEAFVTPDLSDFFEIAVLADFAVIADFFVSYETLDLADSMNYK